MWWNMAETPHPTSLAQVSWNEWESGKGLDQVSFDDLSYITQLAQEVGLICENDSAVQIFFLF